MRKKREASIEVPAHYRSPESLLNELGIDEPGDIKLEGIAQYCGATIIYEPLEGSDARLIGYGSSAFITVNAHSTTPRQRFSAAHELGHWMWDRGKMAFACGGMLPKDGELAQESDTIERRANRYAVDLLLPEKLFYKRVEGARTSPCLQMVQSLAQEFQTSLTATAIRYVELSAIPAVLVATERKKRKWYVRSPHVPHRLRLKDRPDARSLAGKLLSGARQDECPATDMTASRWIENEEAQDSSLREDSLKVAPDLVLTLLSWNHDV